MIIDMRCPACNRPICGEQDIVTLAILPEARACQHCHSLVRLAFSPAPLGERYFVLASRPNVILDEEELADAIYTTATQDLVPDGSRIVGG